MYSQTGYWHKNWRLGNFLIWFLDKIWVKACMENHESIQERRNNKEYACNFAKHLPHLQIQSKIDEVNRKNKRLWKYWCCHLLRNSIDMKPEEYSEGDITINEENDCAKRMKLSQSYWHCQKLHIKGNLKDIGSTEDKVWEADPIWKEIEQFAMAQKRFLFCILHYMIRRKQAHYSN